LPAELVIPGTTRHSAASSANSVDFTLEPFQFAHQEFSDVVGV
jgi:hypothetical protein